MTLDIAKLMELIKPIAQDHGVSVVALFGSQARGEAHDKSDIDIAILTQNDYQKAESALWHALTDALKRDDIEFIDLSKASPTTMYTVVRDGVLMYERSTGSFMKWKFYAIRVWIETAWYRKLRDKKMLEWAKQN